VLVVGSGPTAMTVANHMRAQHDFAYRLVGFIEDPSGNAAGPGPLGTHADGCGSRFTPSIASSSGSPIGAQAAD
jgi:hypothetical protein